jgi:hypothetical protein
LEIAAQGPYCPQTMFSKKKRFGAIAAGSALTIAAISGLTVRLNTADAYVVNGQRWAGGATVNESDPSWPAVWDSPANGAQSAWNRVGTSFTFSASSSSPNKLTTSSQGNTGTLATSSWSYSGGGTISQASTVVNTSYTFSPANPVTPGSVGTFDLQSVMTHELGHWLSLGHSTSVNNDGSKPVMYASFGPGEVRTVGSDDAAGMQAIYGAGQLATPTPTRTAISSPTATPTRPIGASSPTPTSTVRPSTPTPTPTAPAGSPPPSLPASTCALLLQRFPTWSGCGNASAPAQNSDHAVTVTDHALVAQTADALSRDPAVSRIVVGRVQQVAPARQIGGTIVTDTVVGVTEHLLPGTESTVVVRSLGGTVGNTTVVAEDFPTFTPGENVLLFLSREGQLVPLDANTFYVRGLVQGGYHLNGSQAVSALPDRSQDLASLRATIQAAVRQR